MLPDVVTELHDNLRYLTDLVSAQIKHVKGLGSLSQGGDSTHIDDLLKDLLPIVQRKGLSGSYTTPMGDSQGRHAPAVELTMLLIELWPREIPRPTKDAVMRRLVRIRAERNKPAVG